jgi:hypothetical protein
MVQWCACECVMIEVCGGRGECSISLTLILYPFILHPSFFFLYNLITVAQDLTHLCGWWLVGDIIVLRPMPHLLMIDAIPTHVVPLLTLPHHHYLKKKTIVKHQQILQEVVVEAVAQTAKRLNCVILPFLCSIVSLIPFVLYSGIFITSR